MSEFSEHKKARIEKLRLLFNEIIKGENLGQLVNENKTIIDSCIPTDIIFLVDELVRVNTPIDELKKGLNKLLNLLYKTISMYPYYPSEKESFLGVLTENNRLMLKKLMLLKPPIKQKNKKINDISTRKDLAVGFSELQKFGSYYLIKENVLFPVIEKNIPEFRCLSVMWSFHDDIKLNIKETIEQLESKNFNLQKFNRLAGDIFFNMNAIKFREERILYPFVNEAVPENILNSLFAESLEIGFPFYQPEIEIDKTKTELTENKKFDLGTGNLTVNQIKLLFNHLPVDITFVNEFDKVQYFSIPKKRIFPRTKAIIGRDVHNCHPPESVHVVEKIIKEFKEGKKDVASFWINIKGENLLIQYFAVRNEAGNYKGVVEVSQEITEIQNLKGENRLLDWEK